mmetsp:Transcript_55317/g.63827  ORF Transcript_55317/g.63827 Transcript_55317/m.63827 type:complete len:134 (-) Transcript_55317:228-629(-)
MSGVAVDVDDRGSWRGLDFLMDDVAVAVAVRIVLYVVSVVTIIGGTTIAYCALDSQRIQDRYHPPRGRCFVSVVLLLLLLLPVAMLLLFLFKPATPPITDNRVMKNHIQGKKDTRNFLPVFIRIDSLLSFTDK